MEGLIFGKESILNTRRIESRGLITEYYNFSLLGNVSSDIRNTPLNSDSISINSIHPTFSSGDFISMATPTEEMVIPSPTTIQTNSLKSTAILTTKIGEIDSSITTLDSADDRMGNIKSTSYDYGLGDNLQTEISLPTPHTGNYLSIILTQSTTDSESFNDLYSQISNTMLWSSMSPTTRMASIASSISPHESKNNISTNSPLVGNNNILSDMEYLTALESVTNDKVRCIL